VHFKTRWTQALTKNRNFKIQNRTDEVNTEWIAANQSFFRSSDWSSSCFTKSSANSSSLSSEPLISDEVFSCLKHKNLHFYNGQMIQINNKEQKTKLASYTNCVFYAPIQSFNEIPRQLINWLKKSIPNWPIRLNINKNNIFK